jgi:hypothetical protein
MFIADTRLPSDRRTSFMNPQKYRSPLAHPVWRAAAATACAALLLPGVLAVHAQEPAAAATGSAEPAATKLPPEQLEALVAPIALYPDALLAQTLVASTYPLEIIQLQQWLAKNPGLKDKALVDAVAKQPWDPAVQSMAAVPDVVKRLADDIQWTTDLGNAFLAQQGEVMDAAQRLRKKAMDKGSLAPSKQQTVETQVVGEKTIIIVESADPEVVYVPSYSPTVVYGAAYPYYPYPPIYYPPYYAGGAFVAFSVGVIVGGAWGGYCCNAGWGGNDIDIDINNNFNKIEHNRTGGDRQGNWQHNPEHRGAAPYADRTTANKYGGAARGQTPSTRQASARQQPAGGAGGLGGTGVSDRSAGGSRGGATGASSMDRAGGSSSNQMGSYSAPKSSQSRSSGFSGGSSGYSGSSARASSSRGMSSMGGMRGGGGGRRR